MDKFRFEIEGSFEDCLELKKHIDAGHALRGRRDQDVPIKIYHSGGVYHATDGKHIGTGVSTDEALGNFIRYYWKGLTIEGGIIESNISKDEIDDRVQPGKSISNCQVRLV